MKSHSFINTARRLYKSNSNTENAFAMSAYMKNLFPFYGIKKPIRKDLDKLLLTKENLASIDDWRELVKELWNEDEREMHYLALAVLDKFKKEWEIADTELTEWLIINQSWWDTVDTIAANVLGPLVMRFPELNSEMLLWNKSENRWIQRSSILYQLKYRLNTRTDILETNILNCMHSKEFFIRKAIGWSLREYAKYNPQWVLEFVDRNKLGLSALSTREALKHF